MTGHVSQLPEPVAASSAVTMVASPPSNDVTPMADGIGTPEKRAAAIRLIREGATDAAVAAAVGMSFGWVQHLVRAEGLPAARERNPPTKTIRVSAEAREELIRRVIASPTANRAAIGRDLGIADRDVRVILRTARARGVAIPVGNVGAPHKTPVPPARPPADPVRDAALAYLLAHPEESRKAIAEKFGLAPRIVRKMVECARRNGVVLPYLKRGPAPGARAGAAWSGADPSAPSVCASAGCIELAGAGGVCPMHKPLRRQKRVELRRPSRAEAEAMIAEAVAAGRVKVCAPPWASSANKEPAVTPEPPAPKREPSMSPEERRELDKDWHRILTRAARAHQGDVIPADCVEGLNAASLLAGVPRERFQRLADAGAIAFRWHAGKRLFRKVDLRALADRLEAGVTGLDDTNDDDNECNDNDSDESISNEAS